MDRRKPRPDVCPKCGQPHVTPNGGPACVGHRKHTDPPVACIKAPMHGLDVCERHGGAAPQARAAGKRRVAEATVAAHLASMGVPFANADPLVELMAQVGEAAGNVAFLRAWVTDLQRRQADGVEGIVGVNHLGDEAVSEVVKLYGEERDRLANMARLALGAGVVERQVQVSEQIGATFAGLLRALIDELVALWSLGPDQVVEGRKAAARHLRALGPGDETSAA